jgi:tetratricopeptide (TPR) repeat protein
MKRHFGLLSLVLVTGCVYYNGMYNANRLARAAEKAEREGRTFDANSLWGQVGVKADTVLARHSTSKWADDARLLRGKSYQRLGDCNSAVTVLRELVATSADSALIDEAAFLLGNCYQVLGEVEAASYAYLRLVNSADPARRKEALYQYGRSLRLGGRFADALQFLERSDDPRARGERAAALAGAGRLDEALVIADSLIAAGDTSAPWDSTLALVGRHDVARASGLTDRLVALPQATPVQRAGWLYADGARLVREDPEAGMRRVSESLQLSSDGPSAAYGRLLLLRLRMSRAETIDSLRRIRVDLDDILQTSGATGIQIGRYMRIANLVLDAADSAAAGGTSPDLRLFLAAELARDSLEMPRLAAALLQQLVTRHQDSPYAAKAWLVLSVMDTTSSDSADAVLAGRYPDNPYLLAARGEEAPGFAVLEDSLLRLAAAMRRALRPITPTVRQPAANPGSRVPEN